MGMQKQGRIGMSVKRAGRTRRVSRFGQGVVGALATITLLLAVDGSVAFAAQVHLPLPGECNGSEAGGFSPWGVAVDNSSSASAGDVYVTDTISNTVKKLDESCVYLPPPIPGISESSPFTGFFRAQNAVNSAGDLFVGDSSGQVVDEFGPTGEYIEPQIALEGEPIAVAVDSSGRILAATSQAVYRYDPGTKERKVFATDTSEGAFGEVDGVAVDDDPSSPAFGDVYVTDTANGAVDVFDESGAYQSKLTSTPSGPIGRAFRDVVDPGTGDLYVTAEGVVDEFAPTGAFLSQISIPEGGFPSTVAVNAKTGDVYVGDLEYSRIDVFGPGITIPDPSNGSASNVELTSATINGQVDRAGGGEVTSCKVEWGLSTAYGNTVACSPATPYASEVTAVSANVSGLTADTRYHFRIVVHNTNKVDNFSTDATFETTGPPTIGEQSVSGILQANAVLHGHVNPHGYETEYHFEYGPTTSYGTSIPVSDGSAGAGASEVEVQAEIKGLALNAEYHYRLVAKSTTGNVEGPDSTFTTRPAATVEDQAALAGPSRATLQSKVEDYGVPSDCEVEYVTSAQFIGGGYSNPNIAQCVSPHLAGEERALQAVARLSGLSANTTYHYRYVISNQYGEARTADETFITFGIAVFSMEASDLEAHPYTQAGGHPYMLTTNITVNTNIDHLGGVEGPAGTVKDIRVHLPAGLIGNPQAVPQCSRYDSERQHCSADSEIGIMTVKLVGFGGGPFTAPLFNIVPPRGVAAEFSVRFSKAASAFIVGSVRTGSDYGLDADSLNISTIGPVAGAEVRIWGVPADPRHYEERQCPNGRAEYEPPCEISAPLRPFLTSPTSCTEAPVVAKAEGDTYQAPSEFAERSTEMPVTTGCERLHFTPTITVKPEVGAADSPSGLHVDVHVPQEESAVGLAEADLKNTTVVLPKGLTINPASAGGLTGCSEAQIELNGPKPASCPDSSKVGRVELTSPLVDHPMQGAVYVAQQGNGGPAQGSNEFKSLIALYIGIDDPQTGVVVKLAGKVTLDPVTGQLTSTFDETPQLPFEDLKLDFFGGPRAALETPPACGIYEDGGASFYSWAEPGTAVSPGIQSFSVTSGPGGSACPSGAFAPAFTAGTESGQAGAFTPFVLSFSRQDGEQGIAGLEATLAPGLLGKLAGIPLCGDAESAAGACPASSQIGTVTAAAGAGADPVQVQGQVYLTGSYSGGPFGEVVEVPAVAGPFNLGTVVVRGSIRINPTTAQASVVSDPFPTMLQGVPLTIKRVVVTLDRPGFTFNPTDCNPLAVTGKITGTGGGSAQVSAPFQVANCAKLPFKPKFTVSTQAKSSKVGGASLRVKITSGSGQANLAQIKVNLPKQLPSRFSTLQKACLLAVFDANPASCPAGSLVGTAKAVTPLLKAPFTGPAYLVSHGSSGTPDLELVLQSEGVTLIQDGKTRIKNGITSSMFKAIPDAPISMIELTLPEGPHSALAAFLPPKAKYSMCGQKLLMPTQITGQNGVVIKQTTKIAVTGCPAKRKARVRHESGKSHGLKK
jgi:hypothetical protein